MSIAVLFCMLAWYVFPIEKVQSPNHQNPQLVVFQKSFLEWTSHEIILRYSVEGEKERSVVTEVHAPFQIHNLAFSSQFPSYMAGMIHATVQLMDPARNEIECQLWIRIFQNTDVMLFMEYTNEVERNFPLHYSIRYSDENLQALEKDTRPDVRVFRYSKEAYWEDSSTLSLFPSEDGESFGEAMFGQFMNHHENSSSFYTGRVFPYQTLDYGIYQHIQGVETSTYTEVNEKRECVLSTHTTLIGDSSFRDWFVFSANSLLDIESAVTQKVLFITDLGLKKGYFQDGFYYSTYLSGYENESPQGFYWDYSMYAPRSILEYYYDEDQSFLYDICMNSFVALNENQNREGYWTNGTVSKWLREEYGIQDRYFDTRFCTDAALFMLRLYQTLGVEEAKRAASKIGDLLVDGIRKGFCYETPNYGFMLQDYFIYDNPELRVHSSLNHLLNEASFLLLLGDTTKEETYTNAAMRIINSLYATNDQWKNEKSGDLHYAYLPSGEFGLQDYVTLTYHDLIRFRSFSTQYLQEEPPFIQNLGSWKEEFLVQKKVVHTRKFTGSPPDLSPLLTKDDKR
ncbi:MAG: hypothetical protein PHI40_05345 [Caldisericia bacterium]|nr:hypothetical protein [Caldisericia bacterium]